MIDYAIMNFVNLWIKYFCYGATDTINLSYHLANILIVRIRFYRVLNLPLYQEKEA